MHVRQTIRDYFITILINNTDAGDRVYSSRVYPVGVDSTPAILIYTKDEEAVNATIGTPGSSIRELDLTLEIYVKDLINLDDKLDDIAAQIEKIIGENCEPIPEIMGIEYTGITTEYNGEGEKPFLVGSIVYIITYQILKNNPENEA